ncbi:hypothetical protein ACR3K2_15340 [Cryptosporidium serpentis]
MQIIFYTPINISKISTQCIYFAIALLYYFSITRAIASSIEPETFDSISSNKRNSCYNVANYLSQVMQETPPSLVGYFELINALENPDYAEDIETKTKMALEGMDSIMQEIPTQFIGVLFYSCTVKDIDTLLTAVVRNGLFQATRELISRKIYGTQHILYARDKYKDNVIHLSVRAESVAMIDIIWKTIASEIRYLLDEKNSDGQRPIDLSEQLHCATCTTRLKEIYRITSHAHLSALPPPPPIPDVPELEVLKDVKQNKSQKVKEKKTSLKPQIKSRQTNSNNYIHQTYEEGYVDLNSFNMKTTIKNTPMIVIITGAISLVMILLLCMCFFRIK